MGRGTGSQACEVCTTHLAVLKGCQGMEQTGDPPMVSRAWSSILCSMRPLQPLPLFPPFSTNCFSIRHRHLQLKGMISQELGYR